MSLSYLLVPYDILDKGNHKYMFTTQGHLKKKLSNILGSLMVAKGLWIYFDLHIFFFDSEILNREECLSR